MKRIFTLIFLILSFGWQSNAQPLLQASIGIGSTPSRIKIYIKCNQTFNPTNISTLEFNVGVAQSDAIPKPTVVSASDGITWVISNAVTEGGYNNFAITSGTKPFALSLTANTEYEVMELEFPSHTIMPNEVSLITIPDGGSNTLLLFMATGTPSSDGSNLYYTRSGTTVDNQFSYDLINGKPGTSISTATLVGVALPVKLSSFSVISKNNDALLSWSVENQDANSSHFEIERSANGIDFSQVGTVNATSNTKELYSYTDENINLSGAVYYRLKMIDKDGQSAYSDIKSIQLANAAFAVSLYPNPVQNLTKLKVTLDEAQVIKVSVNNALGNLMKQYQIIGQKGSNEKTIDLSNVPSGSYMIRIEAGQNKKTLSVIKN